MQPKEQQPSTSKLNPTTETKSRKNRVTRRARRGRAGVESDDEVVRAQHSDSDTSTHLSDSVSDSGGDSDEDDHITTHVPPSEPDSKPKSPNGIVHQIKPQAVTTPFLTQDDWSQVVQEQLASGADELPELDFEDFVSRPTVASDVAQVAEESTSGNETREVSSPPPAPRKPFGRQSARLEYQRKLSEDPSFVPVVGEFWGHDDRLMDKGLRSLSDWWRGRWMGRGRGGPARGSFQRAREFTSFSKTAPAVQELAPIDKVWQHDAFDEQMKEDISRDKNRSRGEKGSPQPNRKLPIRTKHSDSTPAVPITQPTLSTQARQTTPQSDKPWFSKKPERIWTKQSDRFLFVDPDSKNRSEPTLSVRILLPSGSPNVVSLPPSVEERPTSYWIGNTEEIGTSYVVRLPPPHLLADSSTKPAEEDFTTMDALLPEAPGRPVPSEVTLPQFDFTPNLAMPLPPLASGALENHVGPLEGGHDVPANPFAATPQFATQFTYAPGYPSGFHYADGMFAMDPASGRPLFMHPLQPYPQPHILPPGSDLHAYAHPMQNMMQPPLYAEGTPIQFSLPRQSSRVEIRSPMGEGGDARMKAPRGPSGLRHEHDPFQALATPGPFPQEPQGASSPMPMAQGDGSQGPFIYQGTQYFIPPYGYGQFVDTAHIYDGYVEGHGYYG